MCYGLYCKSASFRKRHISSAQYGYGSVSIRDVAGVLRCKAATQLLLSVYLPLRPSE